MDKEIIKNIFDKHLEHDCFFDKKTFSVIENSPNKSLNTVPNKTIRIIHMKKEINPSKIGKILGIGKSTVTVTIDALEKDGFVQRQKDGRTNHLYLTETGEDLIARIMPVHDQRVKEILSVLSPEELREFQSIFRKFDRSFT